MVKHSLRSDSNEVKKSQRRRQHCELCDHSVTEFSKVAFVGFTVEEAVLDVCLLDLLWKTILIR